MFGQMGWILLLAFLQNVTFSIVSRSRNRDNFAYHTIAAIGSNLVWFVTFRELVLSEMNLILAIPYTAGTVAGSLLGAKISMRIERWLGAASDAHLKVTK